MDSGKAFFWGPSFSLFLPPNLDIFGGVWSLFRIWGSIFIAHCTRTSNLEFQIWGSALIEPKCSGHYFSGFEVPARWNLKSGKVARWSQRVQLNCVFEGLKMAKKCGFQFFHQIETYKRYILEKKLDQKPHFSSRQWVMQSTPPYMRLPPPTRWSTPIPNEQ